MATPSKSEILVRFDDDFEIFAEVAQEFLKGFNLYEKSFADASARGDIQGLHALAHAYRGATGIFSETLAFISAQRLEAYTATDGCERQNIQALVDTVISEGNELCFLIQDIIASAAIH